MSKNAELSIIFPCFHELPHLHESIRHIDHFISSINIPVHVIFVEDGSTDGTKEALIEYQKQGRHVIFHKHNKGRGGAVITGIRAAQTTYVAYVDIDMEVDVFALLPLFEGMKQQQADVAIGKRIYRITPDIFHRFVLSQGYQKLSSFVLNTPQRDTESGFKILKRERILPLLEHIQSQGWFFDSELIYLAHQNNLKIYEQEVLFCRRADKHTTVKIYTDTVTYIKELIRLKLNTRSK